MNHVLNYGLFIVTPENEIIDYNTRFSGITERELNRGTTKTIKVPVIIRIYKMIRIDLDLDPDPPFKYENQMTSWVKDIWEHNDKAFQ